MLVALGGGVVGDIAGFAAAIYQRGMPFVQVPTTLLAQVDSSVGGKTGINHPLGKNMIGAFYQPRAVLIDTDCLRTLPDARARGRARGSHQVRRDPRSRRSSSGSRRNVDALRRARSGGARRMRSTTSCRIKAEIVAADEREDGERALLNFGHTFGHAIENGAGLRRMAARRGGRRGHGPRGATCRGALGRIDAGRGRPPARAALRAPGCRSTAPALGFERWIALMGRDKKVVAGAIRFVLLDAHRPGAIAADVPEAVLREVLR